MQLLGNKTGLRKENRSCFARVMVSLCGDYAVSIQVVKQNTWAQMLVGGLQLSALFPQ